MAGSGDAAAGNDVDAGGDFDRASDGAAAPPQSGAASALVRGRPSRGVSVAVPPQASLVRRPFRFHVYKLPRQYVDGALEQLHANWDRSVCNRKKSNYTMLDWRHAHSLFTADIFITRYLRLHPQHTDDPAQADAVVIPMMSHLYNCAGTMAYMNEILAHVVQRQARRYREMDHRDHYLFWWRWGMHYGSVQRFWRRVQRHLPNVNLISFDLLEIMGRNKYQDFSLALKPRFDRNLLNIIVPYPELSPLLRNGLDDDASAPGAAPPERSLFFYMSGTATIGGVRRWIKWNCDVHAKRARSVSADAEAAARRECFYADFAKSVVDVARLGVPQDYPRAMRDAVFCGHAAGDALSSRRPTSAILAGCVPVLICDLCVYAWESQIDYAAFAVFVPEEEVIAGNLMAILQRVASNATRMRELRGNLRLVQRHFVYHDGKPRPGDALDMLAGELERRGMLQRQFRRWFQMNGDVSSDARDYPADPPAAMKYVRRVIDPRTGERVVDKHDAANFPAAPLPV